MRGPRPLGADHNTKWCCFTSYCRIGCHCRRAGECRSASKPSPQLDVSIGTCGQPQARLSLQDCCWEEPCV